ncbi:MAG: RNA 2',3'-cyclic phosphodiesterase [Parvibaculaceae bacterium]|nr:RNA 2',3'-cyclic phosphodiesterase [Parvibaculaceae bacterium]
MIRLFSALEIPDSAANRLALLQGGLEGARWIGRESFHITLRFFGDVPEDVAADLDEALAETESGCFDVEIEGTGEFGHDKPRALWAGVRLSPALLQLQGRHESVSRRLGLSSDKRKFMPHVTLARLNAHFSAAGIIPWLQAHSLFAAPVFTATGCVLMSARSHTGGGPYVVERRYPFTDI